MSGLLSGLFRKPKEQRITAAEAGKTMAASAANYQSLVEELAKYGPVNEIEAWGLNIFCIAFGMKLATHGRLSPDGEQELLDNFYRTTYEIATDAYKRGEDGYEAFVEWVTQKFKEYNPHAQQYFFQADKNEFDFGSVIVKNVLNREKDAHASLLAFHSAIQRIVHTAKIFKDVQFRI